MFILKTGDPLLAVDKRLISILLPSSEILKYTSHLIYKTSAHFFKPIQPYQLHY